ncbi:hypothetical protein AVEN_7442-1 [Araneus ventricosus]|uniref:Uncharacterized protein n=1 Tax=Araneus ventricosus TaxID=182803 RepID=A0A4Y2HS89_ARAVE|nr:hypothetical protein AVEN_16433-1 [Araneus ventricosus]GBM71801.1 hypothetical protein AVEN_7442-1 [Araneus ventricosus]
MSAGNAFSCFGDAFLPRLWVEKLIVTRVLSRVLHPWLVSFFRVSAGLRWILAGDSVSSELEAQHDREELLNPGKVMGVTPQ